MDGLSLLEWWWTVPAGLALVGFGCSLAGLTRAQRAVWANARITAVEQPAHGASKRPGLPVTLAFQDPATGREYTLPNAGKHGDTVEAAWPGREFAVRYPPGQPESFHLVDDLFGERKGLGGPTCLIGLLMLGLAIHATVGWGWRGALLGFGGLATVVTLVSRDIALMRTRGALLDTAVAVPGRVVSVTKDVHTDGEGSPIVNHAPVVVFSTREGAEVTVLFREGVPEPSRSLGRELTVHYAPADPAVCTPDPAADRRSRRNTVVFFRLLQPAAVAATVAGAVLLWRR